MRLCPLVTKCSPRRYWQQVSKKWNNESIMISGYDAPLGLISFLTFGFSIIAAVLAIDMYKLLRTGEFGKTWRLLIIATVMLALLQVLRMAEIVTQFEVLSHLSQIVELCFVMALAFAFYHQRRVFAEKRHGKETGSPLEEEAFLDELSEDEGAETEYFAKSDDELSQSKHHLANANRPRS